MSDLPSLSVNGQSQQLNEDEASELAKELKQQLRNGEVPAADGESIERMVPVKTKFIQLDEQEKSAGAKAPAASEAVTVES